MPSMRDVPSVAWINGGLVPWSQASLPLEDRGLQFAESLYEVLPVTRGRVRLLEAHANRMRHGAEILGLARGVPDDAGWREIGARLIDAERLEEGVLYTQLTGGVAPRNHAPDDAPRPNLVAYMRALVFPRAAQASEGVRAITLDDTRWENCHLKTTMLLPAVLGRREARQRGANEAILIGRAGNVREGTSSNVFVVERGRIVRPLATHHVLPGVTGPLVSRFAAEDGREVVEEAIPAARLRQADEVFLTSTTRLALGVTHVDDAPVGDGRPGPVALGLAARLRGLLELD
jgi:D-alanine transaminase